MAHTNGMDQRMGTAWYTFFAKVRPWIVMFASLAILLEFADKISYYSKRPAEILLVLTSTASAVMAGVTFWLSCKNDYKKFVSFVNVVLIFDVCDIVCMLLAFGGTKNASNFLVTVFYTVLFYFLWYRLNIKYFRRRIYVRSVSVKTLITILQQCQEDYEVMGFNGKHLSAITNVEVCHEERTVDLFLK